MNDFSEGNEINENYGFHFVNNKSRLIINTYHPMQTTIGHEEYVDLNLEIVKDYVVSIKGPLTTPVGGGIRSLNVALRQELDLYVCVRPVRWFEGVP